MLDVHNLRFHYSPDRPLLRGLSFSLRPGDVFCILGSNGTGKTTLIKCLLGFVKSAPGTIRVGGADVASLKPGELARRISYVPQAALADMDQTVFDVVMMGRNPYIKMLSSPSGEDERIVHDAMVQLGIAGLAGTRFSQLSGGQRQMALIARALAQQAPVMVLDEPTASLDYGNQLKILQVIKDLGASGRTVIMTTHVPDHAHWVCNMAAFMKDGIFIAQGAPDRILTSALLSELYEADIRTAKAQLDDSPDRTVRVVIPVMAESGMIKGR